MSSSSAIAKTKANGKFAQEEEAMSQDQVEEDLCRVCPVGVERDRAYARIADLDAEVRTAEARAAEHKSACDAALVRLQESDLKRALAELLVRTGR